MTTPLTMFGFELPALSAGETLQQILEERGISRMELASLLGMSLERVSAMISGEEPITSEVALQLAHLFGRSAQSFQRWRGQ